MVWPRATHHHSTCHARGQWGRKKVLRLEAGKSLDPAPQALATTMDTKAAEVPTSHDPAQSSAWSCLRKPPFHRPQGLGQVKPQQTDTWTDVETCHCPSFAHTLCKCWAPPFNLSPPLEPECRAPTGSPAWWSKSGRPEFLTLTLTVNSEPLSVCVCACVRACLVAQLCQTLCDPMDCRPPGSSVHGILRARILEWVAMPSSRGSSRSRDRTRVSDVSCIGR